ncbi:MAG: hypothetical protein WD077_02225 [Bacteroidia bacterium]
MDIVLLIGGLIGFLFSLAMFGDIRIAGMFASITAIGAGIGLMMHRRQMKKIKKEIEELKARFP